MRNTRSNPVVAIDGNFLHLPHSGIGTYVRSLVDAFDQSDLGIDMRVLEPKTGGKLKPGGRGHRFLWDSFGVTGKLLAEHPRPALLHLPQFSAPVTSGIPIVVTIHDVIPFVLPEYRASGAMRVYLNLMRRTVRRARRIIVPSQSAAADVHRVLGLPEERIVVVPEAASVDLGPDCTGESRSLVSQQFGIGGPYLFNIGGFDIRKNLPMLVEAFANVLPHLAPETKLVIAGAAHSGNQRLFPPLEPIIARLGLQGNVVLTGRVSDDERRALYQAATAYVTPSMYEGFGLTPLEAMACGTPVLAAARTSLPEVVGDAGVLFEPTVVDLANAIGDLLNDPARLSELSRAGLERSGQFSWESAARDTAAVYADVLATPG